MTRFYDRWLSKLSSLWRRHPVGSVVAIASVLLTFYVIAYPLTVVTYPPITDLPFHATSISIIRHYFDPSWHFREQFSFHVLEVPYWTMFGLGALLSLVMPVVWAAKVTTFLLLVMLPAGLAVMFHGMRKSPLLGLSGLFLVWNTLTHWGFINFMAAIGLLAMVIGLTLLVLDDSRAKSPAQASASRASWRASSIWLQVALALTLFLVYATHIFRFPFALAAVVGTVLVMFPATRRWKPVLPALVPSLLALGVWLLVRKKELTASNLELFRFRTERFSEIPKFLFNGFVGKEELSLAQTTMWILIAMGAVSLLFFFIERRWKQWSKRDLWWALGTTLLPLCVGGVFLWMYLTLPMEIGIWWYVYPRECLSAIFIGLGLIPNLPRSWFFKLPLLVALGYGTGSQAFYVASNYYEFESATEDFRQIIKKIPKAPRLGYMVFEHGGSTRSTTPFIHLPAWVQAQKGGWLSFHMVVWNAWPIQYREHSDAVPPPTPLRFEWTPERFDLRTRGKFFDWFLVRSARSPESRFAVDPSLKLVDNVGTWWLFQREQPRANN